MEFAPRFAPRRRIACLVFSSGLLASVALAVSVEVATVFQYAKRDPYDRANLYGFNHAPNVVLLPDGRLLAAWFSGPYEGSVHQLNLAATSSDGGRNWGPAFPLTDVPRQSDFDPAFIVRGSDTWLFYSAGRWNRYPPVGTREAERAQVGLDSYRIYGRKSADSGKTWSDATLLIPERAFCRANGIVLRNGTMLLPVYDDATGGKWASSVLRSHDDGTTWRRLARVPDFAATGGGEPTITELDNGSVLMALRANDGRMWFTQSSDQGNSWTSPIPRDFAAAASSHALFRTKRGRVILAYNASKPPLRTPLVLCALDQSTMKWGEPTKVAEVPVPAAGDNVWSRQVSYPSIAELSDGTIVVVWTEISLSPDEQSGIIRAARVRH